MTDQYPPMTDPVSPDEARRILAQFESLDRESLGHLAYGFACSIGSLATSGRLPPSGPTAEARQAALRLLDAAMQSMDDSAAFPQKAVFVA